MKVRVHGRTAPMALLVIMVCISIGTSNQARQLVVPAANAQEQSPQPRRAKFFRKEFEQYEASGTSIIIGQAYLISPNGERKYCSRQSVFMNTLSPDS